MTQIQRRALQWKCDGVMLQSSLEAREEPIFIGINGIEENGFAGISLGRAFIASFFWPKEKPPPM
ncbi:hypothetical protein DQG23_05650 [Paenibacillus contaminans]|uniref:Uncharacterized protein n=1 Tax=Paenibacillus contaminans TaxID=450362 RepID=A0A329MUR7_9BACL|nr:hypothetical protein DQG23_05650 [Paenibacillus contaminans]